MGARAGGRSPAGPRRGARRSGGRGGRREGVELDPAEAHAEARRRRLARGAAPLRGLGGSSSEEDDEPSSDADELAGGLAPTLSDSDASGSESELESESESGPDESASEESDSEVEAAAAAGAGEPADGQVVGSRKARERAGTLLEKMERQARLMEAKMRVARGEDSDDEDGDDDEAGADVGEDDEEAEEGARGWGRNKKSYYQRDDGEQDAEALRDEEAEAKRLQRRRAARLADEDFALDDDEEEEEEEEEGGPGGSNGGAGPPPGVERLSEEEKLALIQKDAPELVALLAELQESMAEARNVVQPLIREVREGGLATQDGISYLEAKHLLLLSYCTHIVFYLMLKAEGQSVQNHPVMKRLVEFRTYIEKTKPIDKKLHYQIEKLLKASEGADADAAPGEDGLQYRPNPGALVSKLDEEAEARPENGNGVYRPAKIAPVAYDGPEPVSREDERARSKEARRRARRSEYMQELAQELQGAPEEQSLLPEGMRTGFAEREKQRWLRRAKEEEDLFHRVQISKSDRKRARAAERAGLRGSAFLDDLGDDVADILDDPGAGGIGDLYRSGAVPEGRKRRDRTGDEDVPERPSLGDRRARFDDRAAKRARAAAEADGGDGGRPAEREEDAFYRSAKEKAARKKAKKAAKYKVESFPPQADEAADGKRGITYEIDKNRGLTPHRSKQLKNPRKKHRIRYGQALVRRKGQVQEVRERSAAYGGEASGVKSRVSKSRKL